MLDLVNYIVSKFTVFLGFVNSLVIVNYNGVNITLLGFIGALIVISVTIKLLMPRTK